MRIRDFSEEKKLFSSNYFKGLLINKVTIPIKQVLNKTE